MRSIRGLALLVGLGMISMSWADDKKDKSDFAHIGDLNAEVTVLNVLHTLQLTPRQYEALREVSAKTMQSPPPRKVVKVSDRYRKALASLRDALIEGDDDKIDDLFAKFDEIRQKEDPDFDEVEITDAARDNAPRFLRRLSARQVAGYIAGVPDFPDPVERLTQTMEQSRKLRGKEWQTLRDDSAYQVGWLVAGLDSKAEESIRDKATALLNKAFRLDEKEYAKERNNLEKQARALADKVGPTDIIRHFIERVLAETLSSHRLAAAIETKAKKK